MRSVIVLVVWGLACPIPAQGNLVYVSAEGHQYGYVRNDSGAVLTSLYPVARIIGTGAAAQQVTGMETLYLGRDCDAFSQVLGDGRWAWANGGFVVELAGASIGFPRQEIDAGNGDGCRM